MKSSSQNLLKTVIIIGGLAPQLMDPGTADGFTGGPNNEIGQAGNVVLNQVGHVAKGGAIVPTIERGGGKMDKHVQITAEGAARVKMIYDNSVYKVSLVGITSLKLVVSGTDVAEVSDPVVHCDDEKLVECTTRMQALLASAADKFLLPSNLPSAGITELGRGLHTLQDFYSHSNYAEYYEFPLRLGEYIHQTNPDKTDNFCESNGFTFNGNRNITSGYYHKNADGEDIVAGQNYTDGKCRHGSLYWTQPDGSSLYFRGINNDAGIQENPNHSKAYALAVANTWDYICQLGKKITDSSYSIAEKHAALQKFAEEVSVTTGYDNVYNCNYVPPPTSTFGATDFVSASDGAFAITSSTDFLQDTSGCLTGSTCAVTNMYQYTITPTIEMSLSDTDLNNAKGYLHIAFKFENNVMDQKSRLNILYDLGDGFGFYDSNNNARYVDSINNDESWVTQGAWNHKTYFFNPTSIPVAIRIKTMVWANHYASSPAKIKIDGLSFTAEDPKNLAKFKATTSSISNNYFDSINGVDGVISNDSNSDTAKRVIIANNNGSWFEVDLGGAYPVSGINLFASRVSFEASNLNGVTVTLMDVNKTTTPPLYSYGINGMNGNGPLHAFDFPSIPNVRYVRLSHPAGQTFAFQEIEVVGTVAGQFYDSPNLAQHRPATQSSTYNSKTASLAVDGGADDLLTTGSYSMTNSQQGAWLSVDLQQNRYVTEIGVIPVPGYETSLVDAKVEILDAAGAVLYTTFFRGNSTSKYFHCFVFNSAMGLARTVKISVAGTQSLVIGELAVSSNSNNLDALIATLTN